MLVLASSLTWILSILFIILAYILGSIPFGLVIGKSITGIDVREHGSKNIGTTNCIRVLGKKVGLLVFLFDTLKGALVIILVKYVFERFGIMEPLIPMILYGGAAIIGHLKSVFLKFKGGKAVATSLGVVIALTPVGAVACLITFGIILLLTGYVCLCSCGAALTVGAMVWIQYAFGYTGNNHGLIYLFGKVDLFLAITYSVIVLILIYMHKSNFKRLINGTENCFKKKKDKNKK